MAGLPDCPAAPKHPSAERSHPRDPCVSTNLWVPDPHRHSLLWVPDPHRHRFGSSDRDGVAVKEERFSSDEQILEGGNMNPSVVRVGDSVRRAAGPWTGGVHALLRHLEKQGYPAPRPLGFDSEGREMLSFVPGRVAYPDALASTESADGLRRAGALIADYHRAQASFHPPAGVPWRCQGRDPTGSEEVLAHNDLAPWNLIVHSAEWTFIDWDLVAPGRRLWDLSWALHSFVGLWPDSPISSSEVVSRIAAFCDGAEVKRLDRPRLLDVVIERTTDHAAMLRRRAVQGEEPFVRLVSEGHAERWEQGSAHVATHSDQWAQALVR